MSRLFGFLGVNFIFFFLTSSVVKAQHVPGTNPIGGGYVVSSGFGMRMHPISKKEQMHRGIDFKVPVGTPVFATANGIVKRVKYSKTGYGKSIIISHGSSYETLYAHLSKINVKEHEEVKKGQVIGFSGNTGHSSNPHLHYEIRKYGSPINPARYLIFAE
ncbi:MAG: M23 family metallopeptidase [Flammeovirgaceae bacterium]